MKFSNSLLLFPFFFFILSCSFQGKKDEVSYENITTFNSKNNKSTREVISIKLNNISIKDEDVLKYIKFDFVLKNNSNKDVKAFKCKLSFVDRFGDIIKKSNFKYEELISSKDSVKHSTYLRYNRFKKSDNEILNKDATSLSVKVSDLEIID